LGQYFIFLGEYFSLFASTTWHRPLL